MCKKSLKITRGNQNPYIKEQTTQWPKEKVQKDKQRSTKHTYKTKDRVTRTPLKYGGEIQHVLDRFYLFMLVLVNVFGFNTEKYN